MRDQDAALIGGKVKDIGICNSFESAIGGGREINSGISKPDNSNDPLPDAGVGLKADQGRGLTRRQFSHSELWRGGAFPKAWDSLPTAEWLNWRRVSPRP